MAAVSLRAQAIRLLARREYARAELQQKLIAKGAPPDEVRALLDALVAQGYLSDARYAQALVASKSGAFGRRRLAATLRAKGIARADIDSALAGAGDRRSGRAARALGTPLRPAAARRARQGTPGALPAGRGFALTEILRLLDDRANRTPE